MTPFVSRNPKFSLGDRVSSIKTGLPMTGTIHQITSPFLYTHTFQPGQLCFLWNELFPDWEDKCLYSVIFDTPQKRMTFEEFKYNNKKYNKIFKNNEERIEYNNLPIISSALYIEDDLELII